MQKSQKPATFNSLAIINRLSESGELSVLIRDGYFPCKIKLHLDIFYYVDSHVKAGMKTTDAVEMAEVQFKKGSATIYRILRAFGGHP